MNRYQYKQAIEAYTRYKKSTAYSLCDVYGRFSDNKRRAWEQCEETCDYCGGYDLKVISHNTCFFTAGFEYLDPADIDKPNGGARFVYITANYSVDIPCPR